MKIATLMKLAATAACAVMAGCATDEAMRDGFTLEHTAIDVADPVATANWWVKNLGFEITMQKTDATHTTFIADRTGRIAIELYRAKDAPAAPDYHAMRRSSS